MKIVKLYLKTRRRPIILQFDNDVMFEKYVDALRFDNLICVGSFTFPTMDFKYHIVFSKK